MTKQRGLFISGNFQCNEIDERGTDSNPPPASKEPVYVTQEAMQSLVNTFKYVMIILSFVLALLGWMANYFVSKYDAGHLANDLRSQETSKAMAVAQTQIAQQSTEISTLKSDNSELKKANALMLERILKLEFQNQQSPKNK
ncbi:hypothetical protein [Photobacterium leiognathi]|uniref:hypothetical protein n=1 Tax=Photobacterium leiognathi TaxID=553611 RepID=UPI002981D5E2|nr:hypothetical protein [Photobacterium leiognathi]